jgi:hypothetical protein
MVEYRCYRGEHCSWYERVEVTICSEDCECHWGPPAVCSVSGGCEKTHTVEMAKLGAPLNQRYGLCAACERVVTDAISSLPSDYVALCMASSDHGMVFNETVTASRELPIPINLTFATLAEQILTETIAFAYPVACALNIDWMTIQSPRKGGKYRNTTVFNKAAKLLSQSVPTLLGLPTYEYYLMNDDQWVTVEADGMAVALALLSLHRVAQAAIGVTRMIQQLSTPCPYCPDNAVKLVREIGYDNRYCPQCFASFSELDYRRLTIVLSAEYS